ncbi:MAG TPA: vWA domain-containing protein [Candidatus Kapabacteria bacterium]|nr:vWA domain-containing protein [Candidatus Kapabacteria bacterium]
MKFLPLILLLFSTSVIAQPVLEPSVTLKSNASIRLIPRFDNDTLYLRAWNDKGAVTARVDSADLIISQGADTASILKFDRTTHLESKELCVNFLLDNSASMFHSYDSLTLYLDAFLDSMGAGVQTSAMTFDNIERKPSYDGASRPQLFLASITPTTDIEVTKAFWHSYDSIRTEFTPLFDAMWKSFDHIAGRRQHGDSLRKDILIVVSDGDDNCSAISVTLLQKMAIAMQIPIYVINYRTEPDDRLYWLLNHTNGRFFPASNLKALRQILHDIGKSLTTGYKVVFEFPIGGAATRR